MLNLSSEMSQFSFASTLLPICDFIASAPNGVGGLLLGSCPIWPCRKVQA